MTQDRNTKLTYPKVQVLLGSNATSSVKHTAHIVRESIEQMTAGEIRIDAISRYYSTECFPVGAGPDFVNVAVGLETDLQPEDLLAFFHDIERAFGRERPSRWAQRTLDIDLIAYEDRISPNIETFEHWRNLPLEWQMKEAPEGLILPHPRLQDRAFALIPLLDIAPGWRHPVLGETIAEMADKLPLSAKNGVVAIETP